jgi:hypothetical protein
MTAKEVMTRNLFACCCLLIVINGCAQTKGRWENADLPKEKWAHDEADCRVQASEKITQELGAFEEGWTDNYDPARSVETLWQWQRTKRRESELFEICMTEKGYLQVFSDEKLDGPLESIEDQ